MPSSVMARPMPVERPTTRMRTRSMPSPSESRTVDGALDRQHRADGTRRACSRVAAAVPTLSGRCSTPSPRSSRPRSPTSAQRGTLTEDDINAAMREIRLALLEADVNFKVVKQFTATVKERALGQRRAQRSSTPASRSSRSSTRSSPRSWAAPRPGSTFSPRPPTVILMAGLQGSGKTTADGEARALPARSENGSSVAVAACDVYRPAAVEQLVKVGAQAGATVYEQGTDRDPVDIAALGARPGQARRQGRADRRHERPPARRREAHGGARGHPQGASSRTSSCSSSTR